MSDTVSDILGLIERLGDEAYGAEPVSQYEHAVESAMLARAAGAGPTLVTAALLHDVGQMAPRTSVPPSAASTGYTNVSDRSIFVVGSALTSPLSATYAPRNLPTGQFSRWPRSAA